MCSLFVRRLGEGSDGDLSAVEELGGQLLVDGSNGEAVQDAGDVVLNLLAVGGDGHCSEVGGAGVVTQGVASHFEGTHLLLVFGQVLFGEVIVGEGQLGAVDDFDHAVARLTAELDARVVMRMGAGDWDFHGGNSFRVGCGVGVSRKNERAQAGSLYPLRDPLARIRR